jgi:radical SAM protein with 4Fe4S-binding SPASM domain
MLLKGYHYIYHYNAGSTDLPHPPMLLWVEPTNRCNLRCTMCPNSLSGKSRESGNMSLETFDNIVEQSRNWVGIFYLFLAGESLLHKDLPEMVRRASQAGIRVVLHTNGCLLNDERARALIDAGLHEISFSFDALDPGEYEQRRAGANYEKTLRNIIQFLEIKKLKNTRHPRVDIQCIDFRGNVPRQTLRDFKALFKGLPVDQVKIIPAHTWAGAFKDDETLKPTGKSGEYWPCKFPWSSMAIAWNGDVVACCNDLFGEVRLGNVNETPLRKIWNDKPMQRFRQALLARQFTEYPVCHDCDVPYNHNNGRAPVRWARSLPNRRLAGAAGLGIELARRAAASIKQTFKK